MLIIEKITTGLSNIKPRLTPLEEREEPEDLTQQQKLDTRQDEMQQQHVNQEHQQYKEQQHNPRTTTNSH